VKLLLDQGLPRTTAEALGRVGLDAVHAGAIGLAKASDEDILERARRERETVVTLDADFHALLALSNAAAPAVIRIRIEGLREPEIAAIISRVVAVCEADLLAGAMVTVDSHRIRVRRLPLVAP
jgi:predicted nuclease of predicted toxin-antitoxin system